jgi:hypothetical protein
VTATVVLDATGTVVGSAGMVFKATGGSQGWPGCRRGYRRYCPGYYTPEKVSYTLLEGQQRVLEGEFGLPHWYYTLRLYSVSLKNCQSGIKWYNKGV